MEACARAHTLASVRMAVRVQWNGQAKPFKPSMALCIKERAWK